MAHTESKQSKRILFIGASGSGTSTLGQALSTVLNIQHFDLDDFFWKASEIPFTKFRTKPELKAIIAKELYSLDSWIISGDPSEWEVGIEKHLTHIYLLECPTKIRVQRLNERELKKQGDLILEGGKNYENHHSFIKWTKKYDQGGITGRSREKQEAWIKKIQAKLIRLRTDQSLNLLMDEILKRH